MSVEKNVGVINNAERAKEDNGSSFALSAFQDECHAVALRQDDILYSRVGCHMVVEQAYALRLVVVVIGRVHHVAVP